MDSNNLQNGRNIFLRKRVLAIALVFLVITILAGGTFFLYKTTHPKISGIFNYKNYNSYSIPGLTAGNGMSFDKPAELKEMSKDNAQAELIHQWTFKGAPGETYVAALAQARSDVNQSIITNINQVMGEPKNPSYEIVKKPIDKFVRDRVVPKGWTLKMEPAKAFASPNIKNDAWSFNFAATQEGTHLKGTAVFAMTEGNYYYFMILSNAHNWESGAAAWQHILDSLKINQ